MTAGGLNGGRRAGADTAAAAAAADAALACMCLGSDMDDTQPREGGCKTEMEALLLIRLQLPAYTAPVWVPDPCHPSMPSMSCP